MKTTMDMIGLASASERQIREREAADMTAKLNKMDVRLGRLADLVEAMVKMNEAHVLVIDELSERLSRLEGSKH